MALDNNNLKETENSQSRLSAFQDYVSLLEDLHFLIAQGKVDTDEADRLRDSMDDFWDRLNPREIQLVRGLSADLYTLVDNPAHEPRVGQDEIVETCRLVGAAWNSKDWPLVLELLRERPHPYPPSQVALMRADCWSNLGDPQTSQLFLQKALSLAPAGNSEQLPSGVARTDYSLEPCDPK
jgi:hypothetical protein